MRQGFKVLILEKDLIFYKIDEDFVSSLTWFSNYYIFSAQTNKKL